MTEQRVFMKFETQTAEQVESVKQARDSCDWGDSLIAGRRWLLDAPFYSQPVKFDAEQCPNEFWGNTGHPQISLANLRKIGFETVTEEDRHIWGQGDGTYKRIILRRADLEMESQPDGTYIIRVIK